jgi:uncharacterized protein YjiS (DUF1127 family)
MLFSFSRFYMDASAPLRCLAHMARRVAEMRRAVEGRRAIARMDARMLADIGLSRAEAVEEVSRKPWDTGPRR